MGDSTHRISDQMPTQTSKAEDGTMEPTTLDAQRDQEKIPGPFRQATGPPGSGAAVGVGGLRGAGNKATVLNFHSDGFYLFSIFILCPMFISYWPFCIFI